MLLKKSTCGKLKKYLCFLEKVLEEKSKSTSGNLVDKLYISLIHSRHPRASAFKLKLPSACHLCRLTQLQNDQFIAGNLSESSKLSEMHVEYLLDGG